jgi:hypothetical protein
MTGLLRFRVERATSTLSSAETVSLFLGIQIVAFLKIAF